MAVMSPGTDNKALNELKDEVKDLNATIKTANKANERFSTVLVAVAVLQLVIATFQFLSSVLLTDKNRVWVSGTLEIAALAAMYYVIRSLKAFDKK